jgi:hypothetical protein
LFLQVICHWTNGNLPYLSPSTIDKQPQGQPPW